MRVLFTTSGYPGHVLPLMPFARACARRGHEVCVVGPPAAEQIVRAGGVPFCGCSSPSPAAVEAVVAAAGRLGPQEGHRLMISEGFGRVAPRAALGDVLQIVGAWRPDVVVRESQEIAGHVAAERHGVPCARVALGLTSTEQETFSLVAGPVQELRDELGLEPDPDGERLAASPCLTLVPDALDQAQPSPPGVTHRFREHLAPTTPGWSADGELLVYVTFGSVAEGLGFYPDLYRAVCHSLGDLEVRVLVTVGARADLARLGRLPANVHVEPWVPQEQVLPEVAAVVCHGGYGSVLGALAHGVPLVVMPLFAGDQWHNARRLAAVGAGVALGETRTSMFDHPGERLIAELPGAVRSVLNDPDHRHAAGRMADAIRALPPIDTAPEALQSIAGERSSAVSP